MKNSLYHLCPMWLLACLQGFVISVLLTACSDGAERRLQLEELERQNRADSVMTNDSLAIVLVDYFDRHGTPNERMRAHYILGRTYADRGEAPQAIEAYNDAAAAADTTAKGCDYRTLSAVYSQLANLYYDQLLLSNVIDARRQSQHFAELSGNTLIALSEIKLSASAFILLNQKDSAEMVLKNVIRLYKRFGFEQEAIKASTMLMFLYAEQPDCLDELKQLIDIYESRCNLFDEKHELPPSKRQYYYYKGVYLEGANQLDSAEFYYRKISRPNMAYSSQTIMYKGLLNIFNKRHQGDSIAKYAQLYCAATDSSVAIKDQQQTAQLSASYNYNYYRNMSLKNENKALWRLIAFCLLLIILMTAAIFFFFAYKKYKKAQIIHRQVVSQINQELNDANKENTNIRKKLAQSQNTISQKQVHEKELSGKIESLTSELELAKHTNNASKHIAHSGSYADTEIICHIKELLGNVRGKMSVKDISQLIKTTGQFYPNLINDLNAVPNVDYKKMCVCILTGLNIKPGEINRLLNQSSSTTSNHKKELNTALFGDATANSLHENIFNRYNIYQCFETKEYSKSSD